MTSSNGALMRPYNGETDLQHVLAFTGELLLLDNWCSALHPGDVAHHLSNGLRGQDPAPFLQLYEEEGKLRALLMVYPPQYFYLLLHPSIRGGEREAELLAWSEQHVLGLMEKLLIADRWVGTDLISCDEQRLQLLQAHGYTQEGEPTFASTRRSLLDPIPDPVLPEGFIIREARGLEEIDALGEVHSGAFNSDWSEGAYRKVLEDPAYQHLATEMVVEAPDGRLAAFLIYWPDQASKSGLFEPVGCHRDFQRRGLTRALMYDAMHRLRDLGMTSAIVNHEIDNPASAALYAAVGFTRQFIIFEYKKTIS